MVTTIIRIHNLMLSFHYNFVFDVHSSNEFLFLNFVILILYLIHSIPQLIILESQFIKFLIIMIILEYKYFPHKFELCLHIELLVHF